MSKADLQGLLGLPSWPIRAGSPLIPGPVEDRFPFRGLSSSVFSCFILVFLRGSVLCLVFFVEPSFGFRRTPAGTRTTRMSPKVVPSFPIGSMEGRSHLVGREPWRSWGPVSKCSLIQRGAETNFGAARSPIEPSRLDETAAATPVACEVCLVRSVEHAPKLDEGNFLAEWKGLANHLQS